MKIYPNKNNLSLKDKVNLVTDIPLAYVDTTQYDYNIKVNSVNKYANYSKQQIIPYQTFKELPFCLFDKNEQLLESDFIVNNFVKDDNGYVYVPQGNISFIPETFNYYLIAKKNINYNSNLTFNFSAMVLDNFELANNLMPIFGDAPSRLVAPNNIYINNSDLDINKLNSKELAINDFLFLAMDDKSKVLTDSIDFTLDFDYLLDNYSQNIFLIYNSDSAININDSNIDNNSINLLYSDTNTKYTIKNKQIYDSSINSKYMFNIPIDTDDIKYHTIFLNKFTPILIEERVNKGFIIHITDSLLNNIKNNYKIFYELFFYVYSKGYIRTKQYNSWIADNLPNYVVINNKLNTRSKFISNETVYDLLNLELNQLKAYNVYTDKDYVEFSGISNNYLCFKKTNDYTDPIPKSDINNKISIYVNGTIIYYDDFIYAINDNINDCISFIKHDDYIETNILANYRNSSNNFIVNNSGLDLNIKLTEVINNVETRIINQTYYLIANSDDLSLCYYKLIKKDKLTADNIILMEIIIEQSIETKDLYCDMRQRGGGLPESEPDNYDCFDIGNIIGRPYRKGGSLIITLPKNLKPYESIVMNTVKQYMLAEDYPIIIYKEDE